MYEQQPAYDPQAGAAVGAGFFLALIFLLACGIGVYFDAKSIGAKKGLIPGFTDLGPLGWAICTMGFWIGTAARSGDRWGLGQAA